MLPLTGSHTHSFSLSPLPALRPLLLTCSSMSIIWPCCCPCCPISSTVSPRAAASSASRAEPLWKPLSADGGRLADTPPRENCSRLLR